MTHSTAYPIELPSGIRMVVVRTPAGEHSIGFDEAASLHDGLASALARILDETPFPEAEPVAPYQPQSVPGEAGTIQSAPRRQTTLADLA